MGDVLSLYRITSRMQEIIASTVMGRPKQVAGLMERLAAAAAAPDPSAGILEAVFDEIGSRMPTDRLSIVVVHHDDGRYTDIAARGIDIPGWEQQSRHSLEGSLVQAALSGGAPLRVDGDSAEALETQYPALKPEMDAGLRAWLSVPMAHKGRHVGALVIASETPGAYTDDHAAFGELVAAAVSEVAGAWLSEMAQAGALEENVLAGLGQLLLSSSPDEAYAALATRLWKVAPFDLLAVVLVGSGQDSARTAFAAGIEEAAWDAGQTYHVEPGALQNLVGGEGKLITDESPDMLASVAAQWPPLAVEGLRAVAAAPLPSISGHAGALVLASTTPGSLAPSHLAYLRQAAAMLSACVERDDLLRQKAARSREEDGLAAMGRAVSSAAGLEAALAEAVSILRGLVPADRIEVASPDDGRPLYVFGRGPDGDARPLASMSPAASGPVVVEDASTPTAQASFPSLQPYVQAGLRSFMSVPLAYGGKTAGSLSLGSNTLGAFEGPRQEIVLRVAAHVAGAISARTTADRLRDVEGRERALVDLSSAIKATGDPASLVEAAAPPLRRLVPYDRLDAFAFAGREAPNVMLYSTGIPLEVGSVAGAVAEVIAGADAPLLTGVGSESSYAAAGINSVMALPITRGGALIAGIALGSTTPGAYGDADLEAARVAANMLAGPLYGMAASAEHSAARKEMETIAEIGRVASATVDIREVYGKITELIGTLLLYDRLSVWTADLSRESLSIAFTAGVGDTGAEGDPQVPMSTRDMLGAMTSSEAATGDRAEELSRKIFGPLSHAAANLPAVLLAPLVTAEGTMGLLSLRTSRPIAYTPHDAAVAEMVAAQLAGPMANSQMHAEYKRVEESAREAVQRLERAVTGSGEGLWDWNISEGQVWWSPRLKQMIGVDEPEGVLRGLEARVHLGDRERVFQCLSEHLERRTPFDVTYRIETGPGEIRWFWDRGRAIWSESGSPVRMSGSIRDVTEAKDGAAHGYPSSVDLQLPLRTIESFRQTLLEGSLSESGQDGTAIATRAAPYGRKLEAVLQGLRTLSQAMDAPIQRSEVDLSALTRSIARKLRRDEPERTATISVASGLTANGDPDLLEMALEEMIGNAWKFTSNTEDARIEVGSSEEPGSMAYYVRDNGAGFDPAKAGSVFELFQRLHSDEEFEGAGVGLAIVRHVVRRHGGRVWAQGTVDEGATVHFAL